MNTLLYGVMGGTSVPWWWALGVTLLFTNITILSVTIYLHRYQAHKALELHPIASHFFRFWLWPTTGMNTKEWVSVHRKHHAEVETDADPHSPQIYGIKKVLFDGVDLYKKEGADRETLAQYGVGTPDDFMERHVYSHSWTGIVLMFIFDVFLFGLVGIAVWGIQMLWIPFFAAGVINGIGHYWGYRNYEVKDASTNIVPWGILIGGEELHNNHHRFKTSARFSVRNGEIDWGWECICLLEMFGLAKVYTTKLAPHYNGQDPKRLLNLYRKEVIEPAAKASFPKALYLRIKKLARHQSWHVPSREELAVTFRSNEKLAPLLHFRDSLAEALHKKGDALRAWCEAAQKSGDVTLQKFAKRLRATASLA